MKSNILPDARHSQLLPRILVPASSLASITFSTRVVLSLIVFVLLLGNVGLITALAQDSLVIERAQAAVREKILQEQDVVSTYVPSWMTGQFRGRNPVTRERMTLTIYPSGEVAGVYENDRQENGRIYNNTIRLGSITGWQVTPAGDGFRVRANNRTETFYRIRDSGTSGPIGAGDNCEVPRWMVGRFRGLTNTGESELTINSDGSASIRSLRGNRTFPGRYSEGILQFEFGSFSVARDGDGIRTLAVNNPNEQTAYSRTRF